MKYFVIYIPVKWTNILNILIQVERSEKCTKNHKPYWCQELADVWVLVSKTEKAHLK